MTPAEATKLIDQLIAEDKNATIADYLDTRKDIEAVQAATVKPTERPVRGKANRSTKQNTR